MYIITHTPENAPTHIYIHYMYILCTFLLTHQKSKSTVKERLIHKSTVKKRQINGETGPSQMRKHIQNYLQNLSLGDEAKHTYDTKIISSWTELSTESIPWR